MTTLVVAGISWLATKTADGIAEGAADRVFVSAVGGIRERIAALAGHPQAGDLARGVRQAQIRALERLVRDYGEQRPLARFGEGSDPFSKRALEFCRSATAQSVAQSPPRAEELIALAPLPAGVNSMGAGAAAVEDAVLTELSMALDGLPVPSGFVEHLRNGGRGTPRYVELFGMYFAEQVKKDDAFRNVLHTGLLLQNAANLAVLGDWLVQVEARFGGALARLETGVADLAMESRAGFSTVQDTLTAILDTVAADKGVPAAALRLILQRLGETAVQDEDILNRLSAKADEYIALQEQLSALAKSTPNTGKVLSEGKQLLEAGDLDGARQHFADARTALRATREQHARDEAALLAAEAGVDRLQLRYREAANRYEEAERLISFDPDTHFNYLCRRAITLQHHGYEFGDNAALAETISLWRRAVQLRPRSDFPLDWAMSQNNLGNALLRLGERENGRARLEEAVAAYRAALEEYPRERVPLTWALTLNNVGIALQAIGERESGTERLEEAVAAYHVALEEQTRERVPSAWATTQNNLGIALKILGERESGTARLEEAIAAYRAALEERPRERMPLDWAMTQNNLGRALQTLGERERGTERLEEAVAAFRAALEEYTRERVPLYWATVQNNLGIALKFLGERESGTARLEEAVAAHRVALEERTRERVPLDWARAQDSLGAALYVVGMRERGTERLEEAVAAFRAALRERTRESVPLEWALTQSNLANALQALGERTSDVTRLEEAVATYRVALEELTPERIPLDWAVVQNNLANALQALGRRESGTTRLEEAVATYGAALKEHTRERVPLHWAATQNNLGVALQALGARKSNTARLREAVAAYRAALEERTRERVPLDWAATQNNLGTALLALSERESDFVSLKEAIQCLRSAAEIWEMAEMQGYAAMARANLLWAQYRLEARGATDYDIWCRAPA